MTAGGAGESVQGDKRRCTVCDVRLPDHAVGCLAGSARGASLILTERYRQIQEEGWTPAHDAEHDRGELLKAARLYAEAGQIAADGPRTAGIVARYLERRGYEQDEDYRRMVENPARHYFGWDKAPDEWPWDPSWWKPSPDPVANLVKAGALIAAEIDRLRATTDRPLDIEAPSDSGSTYGRGDES